MEWFGSGGAGFQAKRDFLAAALRQTVLTPTVPDGSYFIVSDTSQLTIPAAFNTDRRRDYNVCRWLTKEVRRVYLHQPAHSAHTERGALAERVRAGGRHGDPSECVLQPGERAPRRQPRAVLLLQDGRHAGGRGAAASGPPGAETESLI